MVQVRKAKQLTGIAKGTDAACDFAVETTCVALAQGLQKISLFLKKQKACFKKKTYMNL